MDIYHVAKSATQADSVHLQNADGTYSVVNTGVISGSRCKALSAYTGVSPTTYRSGTSVQGRARQLLYLCSWTAKRCNNACQTLHTRLSEAGKPPKVINNAIAHKLLRQAFAVATTGQDY